MSAPSPPPRPPKVVPKTPAGAGKRKRESKPDVKPDAEAHLMRALEKCREDRESRERLEENIAALDRRLERSVAEGIRLRDELQAKEAELQAELQAKEADNERLDRLVSKMRPVTEAAFQMNESMDLKAAETVSNIKDRLAGFKSEVSSVFHKSVEDQGVCTLCSENEIVFLIQGGGSFHRLQCPGCGLVNQCCRACLPDWMGRGGGLCMNRGYCDHKFGVPV